MLVVLTLLASCAIAQTTGGPATVQNVTVARNAGGVRVEVILSSSVQPSIETAENPDRILLDFPGTTVPSNTQKVVNADGLRDIRTGQHSTAPPVTRVVLDLDQAHSYTMKAEGNRIIVMIGPALNATSVRPGGPASPLSLGVSGIFRRRSVTPQPNAEDQSSSLRSPAAPSSSASAVTSSPSGPVRDSSPAQPLSGTPVAERNSGADSAVAAADAVTSTPTATPNSAMLIVRSDDPSLHTVFRVKYVAEGVAYLEGGRAQGLAEGMKLEVKDTNLPARQGDSASAEDPQVVAELIISGVAESSAVTDIHTPRRPVKTGDLAYLSNGDTEALVAQRSLSSTRQYPAVISFSGGDTLDEEAREDVPRPPLPSVNRARGRFGLDYVTTMTTGTTALTSSNLGFAFRGDITRIGGTYWNLSGYYRGRMTSQKSDVQTVQDLINHTYHLSMTYDNPNSSLIAGFGRLYLPWAASLDTIDGGYFGKRLTKGTTVGIFGGSTPDPTSWDYSPNRVITGGFINFEGGKYSAWHYSSTSGAAISMINWKMNRPFAFFEDSVSYGRRFAVYEAAQIDSPAGTPVTPAPGLGLGRSFFTVRVQAHSRIELDFNHNYFRDVPTYDPSIIPTGLVDKYLFQGVSVGARVEVVKQIFLSSTIGRSNGIGDTKASLNKMFGVTFNHLPWWQLRASANYARFSSSYGSGSYESISVSRQLSENLRLELLAGQQNFSSALTAANRSRFLTTTWEKTLGPHYYAQGNFTINRGELNYRQWMFSFGYRFDSKVKARNE
jgi:hypothetical protein